MQKFCRFAVFIGFMLLSGFAHAGNPSATLSGQIVAAGNPTVPVPASAAGFTTQVLKADFTVPGNLWSNPANYITNCGAATSVANQPSTWHFTYFVWQSPATDMSCTDSVITTDPLGGQVLLLKILASEWNGNVSLNGSGANFGFPSRVTGGSANTNWLPNEIYTKIVLRMDASSFSQSGNNFGLMDWWSGTTTYAADHLDIDNFETAVYGTGFCGEPVPSYYGQLNEGFGSSITYSGTLCFSTNPTQYHTVEALTTSDEHSLIALCVWFDGNLGPQGCKPAFALTLDSQTAYTERDRAVRLAVSGTAPANGFPNDLKVYIKSLEIWSCPNFATATCPSPAVGPIVGNWCGDTATGHAC